MSDPDPDVALARALAEAVIARLGPHAPCPGHRHPLDTDVVDGVACWVCPQDPAHHAEPILPAGRTGSARPAQFSASSSSGGQEQTRLRSP